MLYNFSKAWGSEVISSPAGYILFMCEGHGKERVGIDGCWQLLDRVYDVFITWFSGNGVYGFLLQIFLTDIMIFVVCLSRVCCVA